MISAVIEVLTNINVSLQLLGGVLIGFKMIAAFNFVVNLDRLNLDSEKRLVISEGMISVILLTISLILPLLAANFLMKGKSMRKCIALILLGISQVTIGIVVIFDIAAAAVNSETESLFAYSVTFVLFFYASLYVLNILTIFYYSLIVFPSQCVLMKVVVAGLIMQRKEREYFTRNSLEK